MPHRARFSPQTQSMTRYVHDSYRSRRRLMCDQYDRVFANTIDQIGPRDLSKFLDGYDKWTIRDLYCRVRETYRKTRPTLMTPIDPIDWDLQHGTAYSKAFDDTVEIFREHLSGIALQSQTVSAPDLMKTYNAPPALRPPGYRLHEILPVVLPDDTTIFDDDTPTSKACESNAKVPKVDFDEFLNPGWAQSHVPWIDDTATAQ